MTIKFEKLKIYCSQKGTCPEPGYWGEMWNIILTRKVDFSKWEPPPPLLLGAWHESPVIFKYAAFNAQLEWAHEHGIIDEIDEYLRKLDDQAWYNFKI